NPFTIRNSFWKLTHMSKQTSTSFSSDKFHESDQQLSRLISNLPGFVYRCANDEKWTMFYISEVCEKVTGYKPEDLLYNKKIAFNDIIHPDYQRVLDEDWEEVLRNNRSFEHEYKIITASGDERWVWEQGFGVFDDKGN